MFGVVHLTCAVGVTLFLVFNTRIVFAEPLLHVEFCFQCTNITNITDCDYLERCDTPSTKCFVERVTSEDGNIAYNMGCDNASRCVVATTTVLTSTVTTTKSPPANTTTTMMTTTTTPPTTMTTDFETTVTDSTTSLTTLQERRAIYPVTIPTRDLYVTTAGLAVYKVPTKRNTMDVLDATEKQDKGCFQCCSGIGCNGNLLKCVPGACYDEENNCDYLDTTFKICNDTRKAKVSCRLHCGLCDLVDGQWSDWGTWGDCSVTCGNGTQQRMRNCTNPAPEHGGEECIGDGNEEKECLPGECPADGSWGQWTKWSGCSETCGVGLRFRDRPCNNPLPDADGLFCLGEPRDYEICYHNETCLLGVVGEWTEWTNWTSCSRTCGTGLRTRSRDCNDVTHSNQWCDGDDKETELCESETPCTDKPAFYVRGLPKDGEENGTIILTIVTTNIGGDYNGTTGEFICSIPGVYHFSVTIEREFNVSEAFCHLLQNNNSTMMVAARSSFSYYEFFQMASNSAILTLKVGDIVKLGSCTKAETFTTLMSFSGYLVN